MEKNVERRLRMRHSQPTVHVFTQDSQTFLSLRVEILLQLSALRIRFAASSFHVLEFEVLSALRDSVRSAAIAL